MCLPVNMLYLTLTMRCAGMILAVFPTILIVNKKYAMISARFDGYAPPEYRLSCCMIGAVAVPVGMWFH